MAFKIKDLDQRLLNDLGLNENKHHFQWYIITVVSGNENKVIENLKDKINGYGMGDKLADIKIIKEKIKKVELYDPTDAPKLMRNRDNVKWETVVVEGVTKYRCTKIKEGNKFNGYVFIKVDMTEQIWFLIRNTQMVTGIVGSSGKNVKPIPVSEEQILQMIEKANRERANVSLDDDTSNHVVLKDQNDFEPEEETKPKPSTNFKVNQTVKIIGNQFYGEIANITNINETKGTAMVEFEFFGRIQALEFDFNDLELYDGSDSYSDEDSDY
ncbi:transcriptional antiterminator [Ureaplasma diversum]|uniref:Transcription termination/antitermination protein NusG n=1 Tax=Ureaplasma diversum TaxID=42094 RepID=A0A0C5RLI2_9BACT|nr:transcription termination/antitermination protein NusG [Ureaplasma diversum]AJQ45548.1 transcriptional antiterminator [Ureaplasma diversum]